MKKVIFSVLALSVTLILLNAYPAGAPAGNTGSPFDGGTCASNCHTATEGGSIEFVTNIPEDGYTPGETYSITLNGSSQNATSFGFQLAAQDPTGAKLGTLVSTDLGTKFTNETNKDYLTHNTPKSEGSWEFDWIAPNTGTGEVTFYSVMIASPSSGTDEQLKGTLTIQEFEDSSDDDTDDNSDDNSDDDIVSSVDSDINSLIKVYPTITSEDLMIENSQNKVYEVYSSKGQLISSGLFTVEKEIITLDVKPGMYIVKVGNTSTKILKQ